MLHKIQQIKTLGIQRSISVLTHRIRTHLNQNYLRKHTQAHSWHDICMQQKYNSDFATLFVLLQQKKIMWIDKLSPIADLSSLFRQADEYVHNHFTIFGAELCFDNLINWHGQFNPDLFYGDISIGVGHGELLIDDIKQPWELSRFYHLFVLGRAYAHTKNNIYVQTFVRHVTDWLDHNKYLYGVNWLCPMEVGIRAINWIVGFSYMKHAPIEEDFWQRFICSLYGHMQYLERNWEWCDSRTSNHYLSDLVAYLYLTWFFKDICGDTPFNWCVQEIYNEWDKQVFADGTDYEGSTSYHKLVTELLYHAYRLMQQAGCAVPQRYTNTLIRMCDFIDWCSINDCQLVTIGDNDSGKILHTDLRQNMINIMRTRKIKHGIQYFPNFGLSIAQQDGWHLTLRHHVYNVLQPSGHFHNDAASVTLAVDGVAIFVDPGSFVYTPSVYWRNYFRSVSVHNTSYVEGVEPVPLTDQLFRLGLPACKEQPNNFHKLYTKHNLYKQHGLEFERSITISNVQVCITDVWHSDIKNNNICVGWNFTLAPDILVERYDGYLVLVYKNKKLLKIFAEDVVFDVIPAWVSSEYGIKEKSLCLRVQKKLKVDKPLVINCMRME